jgi:hypothetical protein
LTRGYKHELLGKQGIEAILANVDESVLTK